MLIRKGRLVAILSFAVVAGALAASGRNETPTSGQDLVQRLSAADQRTRTQAKRALIEERRTRIQALIRIVERPVKGREPFYGNTPRNHAIELLGRYRAAEAVSCLADWLHPREGQDLTRTELMAVPFAGYALIRIGLPSVPAVLEELKRRDDPLVVGNPCLRVLVAIKGAEETERLLKSELEKDLPEGQRKRLEAALARLKDPKFPAEFMERVGAELLYGR